MKERILGNWRTLTATLFAILLVGGVYALARGVESPPVAQASTESALLQAIATKDSNGDGLPDWEKSLYGIPTTGTTTDYFHLGMTDGEAVARGLIVPIAVADVPVAASSSASASSDGLPPAPKEGTLTAAFAKTFFTLFVAAKQASGGADLSESEMNDVATQALSSLGTAMTVAPDFKSEKDLTVQGSGADALKEFAANAEAILMKNTSTAKKSELLYLDDAVEKNDGTALSAISAIAKQYRDSAVGIAMLPVPAELAKADLELVNAMMRTSQIAVDFTKVNDDPLATVLALKQYPDAVLALANAFVHIGTAYAAAGIVLPAGTPGAAFVNLIQNVAASQQAAKKP